MVSRPAIPPLGDEWDSLVSYLDYGRATLLMKCDGLTDDQLRERAIPPSSLSPLGLVRHLTDAEHGWFTVRFAGQQDSPRYFSEERLNDDFDDLDSHSVSEVFAGYEAECDISRQVVAASGDLDAQATKWDGTPCTLRWIMLHMIEEYARHNGHADLLRERLDGSVGS